MYWFYLQFVFADWLLENLDTETKALLQYPGMVLLRNTLSGGTAVVLACLKYKQEANHELHLQVLLFGKMSIR